MKLEIKERGIMYIVFDDRLRDYDCPDSFEGLFSTEEKAQAFIDKYDSSDRESFHIEKVVIDEECK